MTRTRGWQGFDPNSASSWTVARSPKSSIELEQELEAAVKEENAKAKAAQLDIFISKPVAVREAILQRYLNSEISKTIDEMNGVSIDIYRVRKLEDQLHMSRHNQFYPSPPHYGQTFTVGSGTSSHNIAAVPTVQFNYVTYEELLKAHIDKLAEEHFTSST
jgi:hypothetical protein